MNADRQKIFDHLAKNGATTVCEMAANYGWSRHKTRGLLERMATAGLIDKGMDDRQKYPVYKPQTTNA